MLDASGVHIVAEQNPRGAGEGRRRAGGGRRGGPRARPRHVPGRAVRGPRGTRRRRGTSAATPWPRRTTARRSWGSRPDAPGRRFSLWEMLPRHVRAMDTSGDLRRFVACLQEVTDLLLADIDALPDLWSIERAPAAFVMRLLRDLGKPVRRHGRFRRSSVAGLAEVLVQLYQRKGTEMAIRDAVRFFIGVEVEAVVPTKTRRWCWRVGAGVGLGPRAVVSFCAVRVRRGGLAGVVGVRAATRWRAGGAAEAGAHALRPGLLNRSRRRCPSIGSSVSASWASARTFTDGSG